MSALERDDWELDTTCGSIHTYIKNIDGVNRRVQVHFHGKNVGWRNPKLLKKILADIGWSEDDMRRLKVIR